jgi:hypothetical protein
MVLFQVAEGGANASLCRSGVRSRRIELAQYGHIALPGKLQCGHQPCSTSSHHHCVIPLDHVIKPLKKLSAISHQLSAKTVPEN